LQSRSLTGSQDEDLISTTAALAPGCYRGADAQHQKAHLTPTANQLGWLRLIVEHFDMFEISAFAAEG